MPRARLAPNLADLRGKLGDTVFTRAAGQPVIRATPNYRRQFTAAQRDSQQRLKTAQSLWLQLTREEAMRWNDYVMLSSPGGAWSANNAFVSYTASLLHLNPTTTVPRDPPALPYAGDDLRLYVQGGAGQVSVIASGPNRAHSWLEIRSQRLRSERSKPSGRYAFFAYARFDAGSLQLNFPCAAGWYVFACRFVHDQTGQTTLLIPCGEVYVDA